jgi:hypothetical protein
MPSLPWSAASPEGHRARHAILNGRRAMSQPRPVVIPCLLEGDGVADDLDCAALAGRIIIVRLQL